MKVGEEEYRLAFFLENGFVRRRCSRCGCYFWTLDPDRDNCGDSPCMPYRFIGSPPFKRPYTLAEMRRAFLKFFERHGHTIIEPYPVVARWREDLYLTIASIALFQPFVTEGIVPPPANPLVVSQPCIRLLDIDRVGATAGRHLTIFEMGGAHAFNYKDDYKYWKDRTVELCHLFLTEELGLRPELVTYKEDFWEGGGNAGPDVEACVEGLELATLVFMAYKVVDGSYVEMPIKVVDTGYGIERLTWASTGHPTAFHSIYGPLLDRFMDSLGVKEGVDWGLVAEAVRELSSMPVDESVKAEARLKVASRLGVDGGYLEGVLRRVERACALLDHTKCLAFMLADGVVPSNTGEGYLARLVLRRAMRQLKALRADVRLVDLVAWQVDYWCRDYPRLKERASIVLEEVDLEERRYEETLAKGRRLVERSLREIAEGGVEKLLELYDSHGIPPELVAEIAGERGVKVEVPSDFYAMVAKLHERPQAKAEAPKVDPSIVEGLPPTRPLYYEDQYMFRFKARVLRSRDGWVVLDATAFYPEGGGQPYDQGVLRYPGGEARVVEVYRQGDVVVHRVEGHVPEGVEVEGVVDGERRLSLMRHHTATHIIVGAARRLLGEHVWQAGAQKGVDRSRVDLTFHRKMTREELREVERLANEVVLRNLPVRAEFMRREEAEALYGLSLYQGGVAPGRYIRVVDIAGWNAQACGGTHVASTGEVGPIKIVRAYRIQDGVERIEFAAGLKALDYANQLEDSLQRVAEALQAPVERVAEAAEQVRAELKEARKSLERARAKLASYMAPHLIEQGVKLEGVLFTHYVGGEEEVEDLIKLGEEVVKREPSAVALLISGVDRARVVVMAGPEAVRRGVHAGRLASIASEALGGRGGGREALGQGGGVRVDGAEEAKVRVLEELRRLLAPT